MANVEKQRDRLVTLLSDLFQLNQPDLDFGFYRIMHAKADRVSSFLQNDLLKIIKDAFGEADEKRVEELRLSYEAAIKQAKAFGAPNPEETEPVKKAKAAYDAIKDAGNGEGEIYDHLFRFFERYYDNGDFMSRRYYARETDGKAAPYSVPYDGREVYLHWANRDQYYIKTSEYLKNFTFNLANAPELKGLFEQETRRIHCRIIDAVEGEHGNVKTNEKTERYFLIHKDVPVRIENGDLVIQFEYRPDPDKTGKASNWQEKLIGEAEKAILDTLKSIVEGKVFLSPLSTLIGQDKDRTLLRRYLNQYTSRNTMDYFIHKDLGGFMRRELDFYIKNEIMRLDDIESADIQRVELYLSKIKVLRKITHHLIDFLSQLEEFQKKIWLKKKFVVETNYCITLDRIPEALYIEIAANSAQREEWINLYAIDKITGLESVSDVDDLLNFDTLDDEKYAYTNPVTTGFLKANPFLVLDTAFFDDTFKAKLLAEIQDLDTNSNGLLIHSENINALKLISSKFYEAFKCVYIDPPYNTGGDGFAYKDNYKDSSWLSMIEERLIAAKPLLSSNGVLFSSIDAIERNNLECTLNSVFDKNNRVEELIWVQNTTKNQSPTYSTNHEYIEAYAKDISVAKAEFSMFRETKQGFIEIMELVERINPEFLPINDFEKFLRDLFKSHKEKITEENKLTGSTNDEWKGIYNYNRAEYRDANGSYVENETIAKSVNAKIWVWREVDTSMPQVKEDSQKAEFRDPKSPEFRFYTPLHPVTGRECPAPKRGWAWPYSPHGKQKSCFSKLAEDKRIAWGNDENKIPQRKSFLHEVETNVAKSVIEDFADGEKELNNLFGSTRVFGGPKPSTLIQKLIQHSNVNDEFVCDFFAGSGTTGDAVVALNRIDQRQRKYCLIDSGDHFYSVIKKRMCKSTYASKWEDGKPSSHDGISQCIKYIRLETYEDVLNNLFFQDDKVQENTLAKHDDFRREYMLKYWLEFETKGSPSLLNIQNFSDPTAYKLKIKKPGSDEYTEKSVDLIETFNWLIGLHVDHIDMPRTYGGKFIREADPELPNDQTTRLILDGKFNEDAKGKWWFRKIEGRTCRTAGDKKNMDRVLVIWRKMTNNLEEDNLMLDEWFKKYRLSSQDTEFDVIYVNGSNNLPNLKRDDENWKVRLIEESFHQKMWDVEG